MDWLLKLLGKDTWDGSDRRQSLRVRCNFEVQVTGSQCSFLARTLDMGPTGLRVECRGAFPSSLKKGVALQIKHLNCPMDCERETIKARVAWATPKNPSLFQCAALFEDEVENLKKSWVRSLLVRAIKQPPKQKRKYLRVRCDWTVAAQINGTATQIQLRDLSMQGARLEVPSEISERDRLVLNIKGLILPGQIRRVSKTGGTYMVGVNFQTNPGQSKKLLQIIKSLT